MTKILTANKAWQRASSAILPGHRALVMEESLMESLGRKTMCILKELKRIWTFN